MTATTARTASGAGSASTPTDRAQVLRSRTAQYPRIVTICLLIAIALHAREAVVDIGAVTRIGTPDWTVLAVAEVALLMVCLRFPTVFMIRTFRLTGVGVAANTMLILAPLPWVLHTYDSLVPESMVYAIAAAVAAMAFAFTILGPWASRNSASHLPQPQRGAQPVAPCPRAGKVPALASLRQERILPMLIVGLTVAIIPLWVAVSGTPPLFRLLGGASSTELVMDRQAAFSQLGSAPLRLVLGVLRNLLIMFAAGWFVADALRTPRRAWRQRGTAELMAMGVVGLGVFFALLTTERAIVGELLIVCGIAAMVALGVTLSVRIVFVMVVAAGSFPLAVGVLSGAGNLREVILGLMQRIFYLPTEVMVRYFIEFPRFKDYLGTTAIPKMSYLTGQPTFDLSGHIYLRYYQSIPGVVGNANGSFLGVGWAAFGFIGVVLWALAAAVAFVVLDVAIDRVPPRSSAALRGLGVIMAVLSTSSDIFRSVLGFGPGIIDLLLAIWIISRVSAVRTYYQDAQLNTGFSTTRSRNHPQPSHSGQVKA